MNKVGFNLANWFSKSYAKQNLLVFKKPLDSVVYYGFSFLFCQPDEDMFNPDYVEVDRILEVAHTKDSDTGEVDVVSGIIFVCNSWIPNP